MQFTHQLFSAAICSTLGMQGRFTVLGFVFVLTCIHDSLKATSCAITLKHIGITTDLTRSQSVAAIFLHVAWLPAFETLVTFDLLVWASVSLGMSEPLSLTLVAYVVNTNCTSP